MLAGPGSEFSLANPDLDLELDYYDYNVVNAGAAPGSYLGMDPAFLVWIPPFTEDEAEREEGQDEEEEQYEEIQEQHGQLDTEGAALTPAQYRRVKLCHHGDFSENDTEDVIKPKRLDPGECRLHDEIIMEYKARLGEGMLPIHRILEESRVRVSEESLSSTSDVIPNRREARGKLCSRRLPRRMRKNSRLKAQANETTTAAATSSESSTQSLDVQEPDSRSCRTVVNDLDTPRTRRRLNELDKEYCEVNISTPPRTPILPRRRRDIVELNAVEEDSSRHAVNIPLAEFSRTSQESPARVHGRAQGGRSKMVVQNPDHGVHVQETKESFYDLIGEGEDGIKFADDDDEYIDNKVVV